MILYHPHAFIIHFFPILLTFLLFPAATTDKTSYRTLLVRVFPLLAVGNQAKPKVDINYQPSFLEFYK